MAFTPALGRATNMGDFQWRFGTFTNPAAGDAGGAITTGLSKIWAGDVFYTGNLFASTPKFSITGGTMTIVTEDGAAGGWWAAGIP